MAMRLYYGDGIGGAGAGAGLKPKPAPKKPAFKSPFIKPKAGGYKPSAPKKPAFKSPFIKPKAKPAPKKPAFKSPFIKPAAPKGGLGPVQKKPAFKSPFIKPKAGGIGGAGAGAGLKPKSKAPVKKAPVKKAPVKKAPVAKSAPAPKAPVNKVQSAIPKAPAVQSPPPLAPQVQPPAPPVAPKEKVIDFGDWLNSDSTFLNNQANLDSGYRDELSRIGQSESNLMSDYFDSFRNLGLDFGEDDFGDGTLSPKEINRAQWNNTDTNRGYGQGRTALQDSAASRGMRGSSFYADQLTDLDRSFNDQRDKMLQQLLGGQGEFAANRASQLTNFNSALGTGVQDAADRYAGQFGVDNPTADIIKSIIDGRTRRA